MSFRNLLVETGRIWRPSTADDGLGGVIVSYSLVGTYKMRIDTHLIKYNLKEQGIENELYGLVFFDAGTPVSRQDLIVEVANDLCLRVEKVGDIWGKNSVHHIEAFCSLVEHKPTGVS